MRMMFLTLKLSRGERSGSSPLSSCRTICWMIRSKSCQCCRLPPPRLSGCGVTDRNWQLRATNWYQLNDVRLSFHVFFFFLSSCQMKKIKQKKTTLYADLVYWFWYSGMESLSQTCAFSTSCYVATTHRASVGSVGGWRWGLGRRLCGSASSWSAQTWHQRSLYLYGSVKRKNQSRITINSVK